MAHLNAEAVALEGELIGEVLEEDGDRADEDRQDLACSGERYGDRDAGADTLMTDDDEDGGDDGRERGIWCHGCANVHPAECEHFKCTAEDDTGCDIAEHEADERAGDERAMELCFIEDRPHAGDGCDEDEQDELDCSHFECSPFRIWRQPPQGCRLFHFPKSVGSAAQSRPFALSASMASFFGSLASLRISTSMPMSTSSLMAAASSLLTATACEISVSPSL